MPRKEMSELPPIPIVRQIVELCKDSSEQRLSKKAGLCPNYVSQLRIRRVINPRIFHLQCIAELLGYEIVLQKKGRQNDTVLEPRSD